MKRWLIGAVGALLLLTRPALTQDLGGALDLPMLGRDLALSAAIRADAERRAAEKGIKLDDSKSTGSRAKTSSAARLTYTPTPALRQQTVEGLAQRLQAQSPAQAQLLRASFGPGGKADYARLYSANLQGSGFQDNDAASALAAYLEVAYVVVNNVQDTKAITPAMDRGLRNQVAGLLSQNPAVRNPTQLARFGEEMKLQTIILVSGWQESQQTGKTAAFRSTIASRFKQQFGMDLARVQLTSQGFAPKP
jgi:hypothetical protein